MRYRRYGIKSLSESLEYETKQRSRRLHRKRAEKLRNQLKSSTSSSLQANTNVDSPLDSITSFEQLGWGSSVATPSSLGADAQSPASSIKSEDYINQTSTASPATPSNPYQSYSPMHQKLQMESD